MRLLAIGVIVALLAGCGGTGGDPEDTASEEGTTTEGTDTTSTDDVADSPITTISERPTPTRLGREIVPDWFADEGALPKDIEEIAREKVAAASGVEPSEIELQGSMYVTWRDSALGCPADREFYLQVLTDGYLAYFEAGGVTYRVHTDTGSSIKVCDRPGEPDVLPRS